jgi:uncharacterized membrane protein
LATRIGSSVFINAPVERVFTRVARHDTCNDWLEFVSSASYTSRVKDGVGSTAHHSGRVMGRKMEWDGRVTEWVDNSCIVWEAISGTPKKMAMRAENRVEKEGLGARYSLEVEYVPPYSVFGRIMDLMIIRRSIRKSVQHSTQNLKRILEHS